MPKPSTPEHDNMQTAIDTVATLQGIDLSPLGEMWSGYLRSRPNPNDPISHTDVLAMLVQYDLFTGTRTKQPQAFGQVAGLALLLAEEVSS